jgi:transketolase
MIGLEKEENFRLMANAIRALSMDAVEKAQSGHPGMPMGMADVATILFANFLKFSPTHPGWSNRDRFILSAGHGSMLLYSLLYLTNYPDITIADIKNFRQLGSKTEGHPEYWHIPGIETTTGPLGQGLANAVGMAIAERINNARFGSNLFNHFTYTIAGDGCLMEGISQEAISLAGHLKLNKLIVLFDDNKISIDGPTDLTISDDQLARFEACNWYTQSIDGHNYSEIIQALKNAQLSDRPSLIACRTIIAKGAPTKAGSSSSHGSPLGGEEIKNTRNNIAWEYPPFEIPSNIKALWEEAGNRSENEYQEWLENYNKLPGELLKEFNRLQNADLPEGWQKSLSDLKNEITERQPKEATRKSSGNVLKLLTKIIPEIIGGSADLTGSNDTKTDSMKPITASDFSGRYIYYGVREHAMGAIMNGMVLHKGVIPYGGSFLVFTDYCRPAIRLSALMKQRVIYVMTHDSIGLGEDGPTHQPIEHLASLRAIPNLYVYRPADSIETLECWELILQNKSAPAVIALSRQSLPCVRPEYIQNNLCSKGAYILNEANKKLRVTIISTGSEVHIAIETQKILEANNIGTRVISMPCSNLFDQQDQTYKTDLLGNDSFKVAIEAASSYGWERYIGLNGLSFGINSFGLSAPAEDLYKYFGLTADNISNKIRNFL